MSKVKRWKVRKWEAGRQWNSEVGMWNSEEGEGKENKAERLGGFEFGSGTRRRSSGKQTMPGLRRGTGIWWRQKDKSHLFKMMVKCKNLGNAKFLHYNKRCTVSE